MTLIIAGHHLQKGAFTGISNFEKGLFAVADSNITQNNSVLVSGFKKVIEIPIRLKGINFLSEWFNGYHGVRYESACFIAFAGSTLVAQHLINSIKNHLSELYPTYENGSYKVVMSCEQGRHLQQADYSDTMFLEHHFLDILTADYISDVVEHSIQAVLNTAKKHNGMVEYFSAYQAEFILGLQCPSDMQYKLYEYCIVPDALGGAKVDKAPISKGKVAVIGLKNKYKNDAQIAFDAAISCGDSTANTLHTFLSDAIDTENSLGSNNIGKPCGLYCLEGKVLELKKSIS